MAEMAVIDVVEREGTVKEKKPTVKRQRAKLSPDAAVFTPEEREEKIRALNEELQSLFKFFKETVSESCVVLESQYGNCASSNANAMIAVLLEGSSASYSKLAVEIYEKVKERENTVTIAGVKSSVLFVGQRSSYGVGSDNADVLEDETESCLWCWETRDMKFFPSSVRGVMKVNRTCRKRISERVSAVSAILPLLQNPSDSQNYKNDLKKASERLGKVLNESDIRFLAKSLTEKNDTRAEKDAKKEEKLLVKQMEKNRREEEKEKKRMDRELQKEKLQSEKEIRRLQEEAEKEEKRREREDFEMRKQLKRKQEEMERDQRRREKDEAEQKKKRSMQKQASIMERFVQRKKTDLVSHNAYTPSGDVASDVLTGNTKADESVTLLIDSALFQKEQVDMEELLKSHLNSWRSLGHSVKSRSRQHWGIRRKPKVAVVKELKISNNKETRQEEELGADSLTGGWGETALDDKACNANRNASIQNRGRSRQLLQFDKSYRPAFYGLWPKESLIVGPRHPFKKDPELDYDIDSDEEWEEEEPGESLSDCDKDDDENMEEGSLKADDEDESDDGFFVPDGYLSENEGVQGDRSHRNIEEDAVGTAPSSIPEAEGEEISSWFRQLKHLHNLTEHALRKNQPLIITNLMHEKAQLLSSDNLTGASKVEQMFLQALEMRAFPGGLVVEVQSDDSMEKEDQEACVSSNKNNLLVAGSAAQIPDSELSRIVSTIQSCPYGINKVVESLQLKFPNSSKLQLRNKVREVSDFVDNRWQVKIEILDKLGLSKSPERTVARTKTIAAFFSKRCLPPSNRCVDPTNASPVSSHKTASSQEPQPAELHTHQAPL